MTTFTSRRMSAADLVAVAARTKGARVYVRRDDQSAALVVDSDHEGLRAIIARSGPFDPAAVMEALRARGRGAKKKSRSDDEAFDDDTGDEE